MAMESRTGKDMQGGCMCGQVRYVAHVTSDDAYLCHCRMCQHAIGNVSVAWFNIPKVDVRWLAGKPTQYASSPIASRGFCDNCGTSLTFAFLDGPNMDLTVASFDQAQYFQPTHHFGAEAMHRRWIDTRELVEYRADEHAPTTQRWIDAIGRLPD